MRQYNVYIASGWFTPNQLRAYAYLLILPVKWKEHLSFFFPKNESKKLQISISDPSVREQIFLNNVLGIRKCDFMICSTEDKDSGSIFESGFAYAIHKPIVYVNFSVKKFNIMLSESCIAIAKTAADLDNILSIILGEGFDSSKLKQFKQIEESE